MLAITGATKLYYVSGFTDMRSGKYTLANVVRNSFHRNPYNGDGYVFRSKNRKKVKILVYKQSLYKKVLSFLINHRIRLIQDCLSVTY